jgi:hypothetical protein
VFASDVDKEDFLTRLAELALSEKSDLLRFGWDLNLLVSKVCAYCDIDPRQLRNKARSNALSLAKSLICYWGVEKLGLSSSVLAAKLMISQPAVSKWVKKGAQYCGECELDILGF